MSFIFLASPIDQAAGWPVVARVRHAAIDRLLEVGLGIYDSSAAFIGTANQPPSDVVEKVNWQAQHRCDGMLALLLDGVPSIGVPMEIERAVHGGMPVAVIGPERSYSLRLLERSSDLYRYCGEWDPLDEQPLIDAATWLRSMCDGKVARESAWERRRQIRFQEHDDGMGTEGPKPIIPNRVHPLDAGFDLFYDGPRIHIPPDGCVDLHCGLNVELPPGTWGMVVGRSSTFRTRGLLVNIGVIDGGYRGPLAAIVRNISGRGTDVEPGERVAQLVPMSALAPSMQTVLVDQLSPGDRGANGWGSTGT